MLPKKKRLYAFQLIRVVLNCTIGMLLFFFIHSYCSSPSLTIPQEGDSLRLYSNQNLDDLQAVHLKAIKSAKKSLLVIVFGLTDKKVIAALNQKAKEGIETTIIYDKKGSRGVGRKLDKKIHQYGRHKKGHMHQKILVVDGKLLLIGSANFTYSSLHLHDNLVLAFNSPKAAQVITSYSHYLMEKREIPPSLNHTFTIGGQKLELSFLPNNQEGLLKIKRMIASAKKTIAVAMFTWTRYDLTEMLLQKKREGVNVQAVIDRNAGRGSSKKIVKMLQEGKIKTRLNQGMQLLHHKFLYIDRKTLVTGSANWTKSAFENNDEILLILHNLKPSQQKVMNKVWKVASIESIKP